MEHLRIGQRVRFSRQGFVVEGAQNECDGQLLDGADKHQRETEQKRVFHQRKLDLEHGFKVVVAKRPRSLVQIKAYSLKTGLDGVDGYRGKTNDIREKKSEERAAQEQSGGEIVLYQPLVNVRKQHDDSYGDHGAGHGKAQGNDLANVFVERRWENPTRIAD